MSNEFIILVKMIQKWMGDFNDDIITYPDIADFIISEWQNIKEVIQNV